MARLSSTDSTAGDVTRNWSALARRQLCDLATQAIKVGACEHNALRIDLTAVEPELKRPGASFVTLRNHKNLRGCIGSLESRQALMLDVAANACAACCHDPRFSAVNADELYSLSAEISVLSALVPMPVSTQQQLADLVRPGIDGLFIDDGIHRATFLPAVWSELPEKSQFITQLKRKAGLDNDYWSPAIHCFRYAVDEFHIASLH
jgi:AmmeMemoRadiSam system protein A